MNPADKFLESIHGMIWGLKAVTGNDNPLTEIYLSRESFDSIMIAFHKRADGYATFMPSDIATFEIMGVKIRTR
jgi:hypothetical protein